MPSLAPTSTPLLTLIYSSFSEGTITFKAISISRNLSYKTAKATDKAYPPQLETEAVIK